MVTVPTSELIAASFGLINPEVVDPQVVRAPAPFDYTVFANPKTFVYPPETNPFSYYETPGEAGVARNPVVNPKTSKIGAYGIRSVAY